MPQIPEDIRVGSALKFYFDSTEVRGVLQIYVPSNSPPWMERLDVTDGMRVKVVTPGLWRLQVVHAGEAEYFEFQAIENGTARVTTTSTTTEATTSEIQETTSETTTTTSLQGKRQIIN